MKLLIADDERPLVNFLERGLTAEGYQCQSLTQLHQLCSSARLFQPDVIVLDRMFVDEDSLTVLPQLRRDAPQAKIILLSALHEVSDRIAGLKRGADDYLAKPFDFDELLARIEVLLRRNTLSPPTQKTALHRGHINLDLNSHQAWSGEQLLALTKIEFDLLKLFLENEGVVFSRERILNRVWGTQADPQTNVVDVYISRLRQKIMCPHSAGCIQTLRGTGYRFSLCSTDQCPK